MWCPRPLSSAYIFISYSLYFQPNLGASISRSLSQPALHRVAIAASFQPDNAFPIPARTPTLPRSSSQPFGQTNPLRVLLSRFPPSHLHLYPIFNERTQYISYTRPLLPSEPRDIALTPSTIPCTFLVHSDGFSYGSRWKSCGQERRTSASVLQVRQYYCSLFIPC